LSQLFGAWDVGELGSLEFGGASAASQDVVGAPDVTGEEVVFCDVVGIEPFTT